HVLSAVDVRRRRPPRGLQPLIAHPVLRPVRQILNAAVVEAPGGALFRHSRDIARQVPRHFLSAVPAERASSRSFEQQLVGGRRAPACLLHALEDVRRRPAAGVAADFWRRRRRRGAERARLARRAADDHAGLLLTAAVFLVRPRRALTWMLLVPEQIELVAR